MDKDLPGSMLAFHRSGIQSTGARLGRLLYRDLKAIETPHYVATTSRGAVPHISPDLLQRHSAISSVYLGLEDFTEKKLSHAPILKTPVEAGQSRLREFIGSHNEVLTIMGPRRIPPLPCRLHNTNSAISISTSVGFSQVAAADYHAAVQSLAPDILVAMADVVVAESASVKQIEKSADRTHAWWQEAAKGFASLRNSATAVFAALPPVENVQQKLYLQDLADEYRDSLQGLALYSANAAVELPHQLEELPRLCLANPDSPHTLLDDIGLGVDLMTVPFVSTCSDYGIALTFEFPGNTPPDDQPLPLGLDLWSAEHQTSLLPLTPECPCFGCTRHHRAYIHHLLQVKEMLAWTLLQLHNYAVLDRFFAVIRTSIQSGSFERDVATFHRAHVRDLPKKTGKGPRIRGYQAKSVGGGEEKMNEKAWGRFSDSGPGREVDGVDGASGETGETMGESSMQAEGQK